MNILQKTGLFLLLLAAFLWVFKFISPNLRIEGYEGVFCELLFPGEDTRYANGYSHIKFLKIRVGMTEKEVIDILGQPLSRWQPDDNCNALQYSESSTSTHYRMRKVILAKGKVEDIEGYYYVD